MHKRIDSLLFQADYDTGDQREVLLADVGMGWNSAQHAKNIITLYHRFGTMPHIIGSLEDRSSLMERVYVMYLAREENAAI